MNDAMENALIVALLLLLCILPVYIINRNAKKRRKERLNSRIAALAAEKSLDISFSEQLDLKALAVDENKKVFIFINGTDNAADIIDLTQIKACVLRKTMKNNIAEAIELHFETAGSYKPAVISIYRKFNDNEMLVKEWLILAEAWADRLNKSIPAYSRG